MNDLIPQFAAAGLIADPAAVSIQPLTGGVSSEIALIREPGRRSFVAKRALSQLRVSEEWYVDLSRNGFECDYLEYVGHVLPHSVPAVLARGDGWFAMEYLDTQEHANWKSLLLSGDVQAIHSARAGETLARIHQFSYHSSEARKTFHSFDNFHQLRIDPYFVTTARRHPNLAAAFQEASDQLTQTSECLVHGDFSPKNILVSASRLIVLDCEVAWFGDPSFDVAFLLNHLLLKSLYHAPANRGLADSIEAFLTSYFTQWPAQRDSLEQRTARLLPLLLLARVDGKSPAEYLTNDNRNHIRKVAPKLIGAPLADITGTFLKSLDLR
ncbi:MAG: phosphotransferase [Bryobacteraceae bacterium]|nr:phosphotransferase [Bryobacteraceae bacterium]